MGDDHERQERGDGARTGENDEEGLQRQTLNDDPATDHADDDAHTGRDDQDGNGDGDTALAEVAPEEAERKQLGRASDPHDGASDQQGQI